MSTCWLIRGNVGIVPSCEKLRKRIWGYDDFGDPRASSMPTTAACSCARDGPTMKDSGGGCWVRRRGWVLGALVVLAALLGACVYPKTPDGQPVPGLVISTDKPDPVSGFVTVTASPVNFRPDHVEFRLDNIGGPPRGVDDTAPFTFSIDAATVTAGRFWMRSASSWMLLIDEGIAR